MTVLVGITYISHPRGYKHSSRYPVLRGYNHCPYCLCKPCVIAMPPDFLRGSCSPHQANNEKQYRLYRLFWRLLKDIGLWMDEEYLVRKEARTVQHDKREIMPTCVIKVGVRIYMYLVLSSPYLPLELFTALGNTIKIPQS